MPQYYKRKPDTKPRKKIDPEAMKLAVLEAKQPDSKLLAVAKRYGIDRMTLKRYVKKYEEDANAVMTSEYKKRMIFSEDNEKVLAEYLKICAKLHHGLDYRRIRKLAFELAEKNNIAMPAKWIENKMASEDWMKGFMKRNYSLSLRTPEGTSLSRSTAFNKKNVSDFYENLETVLEREKILPENIWNIDETGYTTVQKTKKVVAPKGQKQVGQVTSGERGTLVTITCSISASGKYIPSFMVFPRVNFKPVMLANAFEETTGVAHPSGWMTSENFILFLQHFVKYSGCTKEKKALIIMDNHESHISLQSLDYAKENGIILLTLPPHCSYKLQPLDVAVFSSFKNACDRAATNWMIDHPCVPISIYEIAGIVAEALPISFTPKNIKSGFQKTGIWPFDKNIFKEEEFLPSYLSDRPQPEQKLEGGEKSEDTVSRDEIEPQSGSSLNKVCPQVISASPKINILSDVVLQPGTSSSEFHTQAVATDQKINTLLNIQSSSSFTVSPSIVLPYPKAGARKNVSNPRKRIKSAIITDTPVKNELEVKLREREEKKEKKQAQNNKKPKINDKTKAKVKQVKRKVFEETSSDEDQSDDICYDDSDDSDETENIPQEYQILSSPNEENLKKGKFVIACFKGGRRLNNLYRYACVIDDVNEEQSEYRIISMKAMDKSLINFTLVDTDISYVNFEDIIGLTPDPTIFMKGERVYYKFPMPLDVFEHS